MIEAVGNYTGQQLGAPFFRGSKPIDGVWVTSDVQVTGACVMPAGYGIGDHRLFVVDLLTPSLVGMSPPKIVRAAARRLNTKIPSAERKHVTGMESLLVEHNILEIIGKAYTNTDDKLELKRKLDCIDAEKKDYMLCAEKKYRRISSGRIPFSPELSKWIRRA